VPQRLPDETRITGRLPSLDIDIRHRRDDVSEQVSITLVAMPSLEAFARLLDEGNPFLVWASFNPWALWMQAAERFWLPMLRALPGATSPETRGTPR
jgi:hypothetical protein